LTRESGSSCSGGGDDDEDDVLTALLMLWLPLLVAAAAAAAAADIANANPGYIAERVAVTSGDNPGTTGGIGTADIAAAADAAAAAAVFSSLAASTSHGLNGLFLFDWFSISAASIMAFSCLNLILGGARMVVVAEDGLGDLEWVEAGLRLLREESCDPGPWSSLPVLPRRCLLTDKSFSSEEGDVGSFLGSSDFRLFFLFCCIDCIDCSEESDD
jgi:hypothetical protein